MWPSDTLDGSTTLLSRVKELCYHNKMDTPDPNTKLYENVAVRPPTVEDVGDMCRTLGFTCNDGELQQFTEHMGDMMGAYETVEKMVAPTLPVKYPRVPGYRPDTEENKYNAWYWKCDIAGSGTGPLKGKRVAVKDTVCVAGMPMMAGLPMLEHFVPDIDATVVTRILDAGGRIVGKTNVSNSGSSFIVKGGPTLNPYDTRRSSGGSSCGSAVVVQTGEADMAVGGDQGGSIRIPSSWCGIVGLKPTWGLVPYTGAAALEMTVDHLGPMARTVADCALLLECIAGYDNGMDHRQPRDLKVPKYTQLLSDWPTDLLGKSIGLLKEGFSHCDEDVQTVVRKAAHSLHKFGLLVHEFSLPEHDKAGAVFGVITGEGMYQSIVNSNGAGRHYKGFYPTALMDSINSGMRAKADTLPETVKSSLLFSGYVSQKYGNKFYAKAQNLNMKMTEAYSKALDEYDVLVMPTLPTTAQLLPTTQSTVKERLQHGFSMTRNTGPFNSTGFPALTINAGMSSKNMPVGMMIVGKHFDEVTVLQVAQAYERIRDGK